MADNNLARSRNDLPDFFADDDPLAELARIVGYEDRPAQKHAASGDAASQSRREPALNLEDELLREFERYDAPRLDPVHDIALDDAPYGSEEPAPAVSVSGQPADAPRHSPEAEEWDFVPVVPNAAETSPASPLPVGEVEDLDDFGFGDEEPPAAAYVEPAVEVVARPLPQADRVEPAFDPADVSAVVPVPPVGHAAPAPEEQLLDEFDLAAELESSIGAEAIVETESEAVPAPKAGSGYVPGFRMPLANFARASMPAAPRQEPAAPELGEHAAGLSAREDFPAAPQEPVSVAEVPAPAVSPASRPVVSVEVASTAPSAAPVAAVAEPAQAEDRFSALDELIYDVQRYEVSAADAKPKEAVSSAPVAQAAFVEPVLPVVEAPVAPAAKVPAVEEKDPFSDEEFELALDDLELDLADIVVEETRTQPEKVVAAAPRPEVAAPRPEAPVEQVAPVAVAAAAAVAATPAAAEAADDAEVTDLPFDPAQIADSEDQVEAIAELDVPALPVEEPEQPQVYRPEYDLDIDAELATLLMTPDKADAAPARKPEIDIATSANAAAGQAGRQTNLADLDDFERALEEDFRRSLAAPLPQADHEELQYAEADYVATVETARRSAIGRWAVPLALAGVVVLGGVGAYAWLGNGVSAVVSGGEPVVIAADPDPVKIAPENPGGKTVPNQDKAVYDRVAGVASQEPKQQSLISSNEEPVDVVQKTLMPDTLPLEGENDIEPTDIGETDDPRLLPQQQEQAAVSGAQQPVAVMPRKVKTMIVRPDGKLVEQEVPTPALAASEPGKVPAAGTKPAEVAAVSQHPPASAPAAPVQAHPAPAAPNAGTAGAIPVSAPAAPAAASAPLQAAPAEAAPAAEVPAQASAPAAVVKAPVPIARPAEQPVNVVAAVTDQGNVRAPNAAPAASAQTASVGDGGYVIQIASLPSQAEAQKSYQSLSSKFGGVIGGRGVDIKAAEIAGKGTFYRVRIPAGSKNDAVALCERYRAAGGSCLVAR
ncbi:SPOR domain-containing protein [Rhizobium puerariae]|uniref:SPOR domain-containing protein n=1 Tax=Rhizobium puerariae TaxID=1585791 RepID=A0ABV6AQL2_9HYPH